ncbi:MAG TPA: hypothetical protein VG167_15865 [Verrucomicrobiae bacterium]|nr:hypothetical protein [Verrucomicrobiae bacterium]
MTFLEVAPATVAVLIKPLEWLTEGLHPYPRQSLDNLVIAFPLLFVYWGCVGALVTLLIRVAFHVFDKPEQARRDDPGSPNGS